MTKVTEGLRIRRPAISFPSDLIRTSCFSGADLEFWKPAGRGNCVAPGNPRTKLEVFAEIVFCFCFVNIAILPTYFRPKMKSCINIKIEWISTLSLRFHRVGKHTSAGAKKIVLGAKLYLGGRPCPLPFSIPSFPLSLPFPLPFFPYPPPSLNLPLRSRPLKSS